MVVIDSKNSVVEISNTINTLTSYVGVSEKTKKSVSLYYIENSTRNEADKIAINFIGLLTLIMNRKKTKEFDTTDLKNYINFDTVTNNNPSVSIIELCNNTDSIAEQNTGVVSTILVTTDTNENISKPTPEYLSTCIITDPEYTNESIRIDNIIGKLAIIINRLNDELKNHIDSKKVTKIKHVEVSDKTDEGIVL